MEGERKPAAASRAAKARRRSCGSLHRGRGLRAASWTVKYAGAKRFGLGRRSESVRSPRWRRMIKRRRRELGVEEIVIGMAHRGRLNVLDEHDGQALCQAVFSEFQGKAARPRQATSRARATSSTTSARRADRDARRRSSRSIISLTRQPVAPRGGQPGGTAARCAPSRPSAAAKGARIRSARRQVMGLLHARRRGASPARGRGGGDVCELAELRRLPHRRHGALRRQQPDRVHDESGAQARSGALLHVGGGEDRPGAGLPRERRRPGGGRAHVCPHRGGVPRRRSRRTWWWTCSATGGTATTRATSRPSPSPLMYRAVSARPDDGARALRRASWWPRAC